jgi:hypothetical protein
MGGWILSGIFQEAYLDALEVTSKHIDVKSQLNLPANTCCLLP